MLDKLLIFVKKWKDKWFSPLPSLLEVKPLPELKTYYVGMFIEESFAIERIYEPVSMELIEKTKQFLTTPLTLDSLLDLADTFLPEDHACIRDDETDVAVGRHIAPCGYKFLKQQVERLLFKVQSLDVDIAASYHMWLYLHPMPDGNGRCGRFIWLWYHYNKRNFPVSFLSQWHYDSLRYFDKYLDTSFVQAKV